MKILIVEDEPKTGEYLRQGLNEAGFVADLAATGSDGLHLALHGEYDLVILDVMLPELDGWQVLASLRRRGLEMPVLFLTGSCGRKSAIRGTTVARYLRNSSRPMRRPKFCMSASRISALSV